MPAAYVIVRRTVAGTEQVLLQLRQHTGYYDGHWATAAAGHVEAGESVLAAALREADEELGIALRPADLVPVTSLHRTAGDGRAINERVDWFFQVRRWSGTPARREPTKSAALEWFDLDRLPEPMVPHERFVYQALRAGSMPVIAAYGF